MTACKRLIVTNSQWKKALGGDASTARWL